MNKKRFEESGFQRKLRDPRWIRKKFSLFKNAQWKCQSPGCIAYCIPEELRSLDSLERFPLCVHHLYYERNLDPWNYPDSAFMVTCQKCHEERLIAERAVKKEVIQRLRNIPTPFMLDVLNEAFAARGVHPATPKTKGEIQ